MNKKELKNNFYFSDELEKNNYSYGKTFLEIYTKYENSTNKKNLENLELFIKTYINRFTIYDIFSITNNVKFHEIIDFILQEVKQPEHNISESMQSLYVIAFQQAINNRDIQNFLVHSIAKLSANVLDLEKAISNMEYQLKDTYMQNSKFKPYFKK